MGTTRDHRRCAEECVARAQLSEHEGDKALWLTLAQSWVRLAEHVARERSGLIDDDGPADDEAVDLDDPTFAAG